MSQPLPKLLAKCPLREVIFELRFVAAKPAAGDLLPGILYSTLKKDYSELIPLPMANVPRALRNQNPDLLYQPSHRLSGGPHSVHVGDRMVNLQTVEYPGWSRFKDKAKVLIDALQKTELAKQIERFSFKYTNLIEASESESQLPLLNIRVEVTGKPPIEKGFLLRTEIHTEKYITIIQVATNAIATQLVSTKEASKQLSGLMVDVDTVSVGVGNEFWANRDSLLEEGHMVAKQTFFSLLTKTALERMEPKWS